MWTIWSCWSTDEIDLEFRIQRFKGVHVKKNVKCEVWSIEVFVVRRMRFRKWLEEMRKRESPKCKVQNARFGVWRAWRVWRSRFLEGWRCAWERKTRSVNYELGAQSSGQGWLYSQSDNTRGVVNPSSSGLRTIGVWVWTYSKGVLNPKLGGSEQLENGASEQDQTQKCMYCVRNQILWNIDKRQCFLYIA